jgi:D-methionine transport system ATP-binding protein
VELAANEALLNQFIDRCKEADLTVEILGYVTDNVL